MRAPLAASAMTLDPSGAGRPLAQLLAGRRLRMAAVAGISLIGGLTEAVVLVAIVQAAVAVSGKSPSAVSVGPFEVTEVDVSVLLLVALAATMVRVVCELGRHGWAPA